MNCTEPMRAGVDHQWSLEVVYLVNGTTTTDIHHGVRFSRQMFPDGRANIVQYDSEGTVVGTWQYLHAERISCLPAE